MTNECDMFPSKVIGVDFSGAQDCGKKIWIAEAESENGLLHLRNCRALRDLPESSVKLDVCLPRLRQFISDSQAAIVGCDFPFGLPRGLTEARSWLCFLRSFADRYASADELFRARDEFCGQPRRRTDKETQTPLSPNNKRLYKQTFYGIRDVVEPLVRLARVAVLPMQASGESVPLLVEICPASTLKNMDLHVTPYKGRTDKALANREYIIRNLETRGLISISDPRLRDKIVREREGDALDSVVAAVAAARALLNPDAPEEGKEDYLLEGYVYV